MKTTLFLRLNNKKNSLLFFVIAVSCFGIVNLGNIQAVGISIVSSPPVSNAEQSSNQKKIEGLMALGTPEQKATITKLYNIYFGAVYFSNTTLSEGMAYLQAQSALIDPEQKGVKIVILQDDLSDIDHSEQLLKMQREHPDMHLQPDKDTAEPRGMISGAHGSLVDMISSVALTFGLYDIQVDPSGTVIVDRRKYAKPAGDASASYVPTPEQKATVAKFESIVLPSFRINSLKNFPDIIKQVQDQSISLDPEKKGIPIIIQLTPKQLANMEADHVLGNEYKMDGESICRILENLTNITGLIYQIDPSGTVVISPRPSLIMGDQTSVYDDWFDCFLVETHGQTVTKKKLKQILLTNVNIQNEKLSDVLQYIMDQSQQLDPEKAGVKIILGPLNEAAPLKDWAFNFTGDKMSLEDLLKQLMDASAPAQPDTSSPLPHTMIHPLPMLSYQIDRAGNIEIIGKAVAGKVVGEAQGQ